jgi:hypothetical protein
VTLARLSLAWVPLGVWFLIAGWVGRRLIEGTAPMERAPAGWRAVWTLAEAGVVTLFGSLWFDTLGSGGWWLLFALVGLLVAFPTRLTHLTSSDAPRRPEITGALIDVARYIGAGAILAWRLGS